MCGFETVQKKPKLLGEDKLESDMHTIAPALQPVALRRSETKCKEEAQIQAGNGYIFPPDSRTQIQLKLHMLVQTSVNLQTTLTDTKMLG